MPMMLAAAAHGGAADEAFAPQQIKQGAAIYEQNCSPCHGNRMLESELRVRSAEVAARSEGALRALGDEGIERHAAVGRSPEAR